MNEEVEVQAQTPGVFYRGPEPDESPFVEEGDTVESGNPIAMIGLMKTFHELTAPVDGTLKHFLVEEKEEVLAGQPVALLTVH